MWQLKATTELVIVGVLGMIKEGKTLPRYMTAPSTSEGVMVSKLD